MRKRDLLTSNHPLVRISCCYDLRGSEISFHEYLEHFRLVLQVFGLVYDPDLSQYQCEVADSPPPEAPQALDGLKLLVETALCRCQPSLRALVGWVRDCSQQQQQSFVVVQVHQCYALKSYC